MNGASAILSTFPSPKKEGGSQHDDHYDYMGQCGSGEGVVCANSDGQYLASDILRITDAVREHRGHIVLGSRQFTGKVPFRMPLLVIPHRYDAGILGQAVLRHIQERHIGRRPRTGSRQEWIRLRENDFPQKA